MKRLTSIPQGLLTHLHLDQWLSMSVMQRQRCVEPPLLKGWGRLSSAWASLCTPGHYSFHPSLPWSSPSSEGRSPNLMDRTPPTNPLSRTDRHLSCSFARHLRGCPQGSRLWPFRPQRKSLVASRSHCPIWTCSLLPCSSSSPDGEGRRCQCLACPQVASFKDSSSFLGAYLESAFSGASPFLQNLDWVYA